MSILLASISALEFWRYAAHASCMPPASSRGMLNKPLAKPSFREVEAMRSTNSRFLSNPVHLLVSDESARCRAEGVACHTASSEVLYNQVFCVGEGVFVVPPNVALLQSATVLPLPNLVEMGCELCGEYARPIGEFDSCVQRVPLTNVLELERFLSRAGSVKGARAMRRAMRFILDGSMSPMETVTVVILCFPPRLGGYGLPLPKMNAVISVSAKDRPFVKKSCYKCDLYWPEARFAIEYDSNLHHTGAERIAEDASRRADLAYLGVEVATLTQRQAYDRRETARIARLLAKRLGKRLRSERFDPASESALRSCLLKQI